MSKDSLRKAEESDAPASAAVAQKDVQKAVAEENAWKHAAVVGRTLTINRSREELYAFWRDVSNLAKVMENVESITPLGPQRSRWTVKAPGGGTVSWESEITCDEPGALIAWRSVEGADINNVGEIRFEDAAPGRGTAVTATFAYEPPGGDVGKLAAKALQREPKTQTRRDLRRFKQFIETGEVSTSARNRAGLGEPGAPALHLKP